MYHRKFGDLKANKGNGHYKTECNGITGVLVHEGEPDEPWRVQREIVDSLDKTDVMHSGGSDSEIDPEDIQVQFHEMSKAANDQY